MADYGRSAAESSANFCDCCGILQRRVVRYEHSQHPYRRYIISDEVILWAKA
jgi:hypothetical protein